MGKLTHYRIVSGEPAQGSQPPGSYNVMLSGAHGNGTTDDYQHILDAITAAGSAAVYFPPGTYLLSSTLTVPDGTDFVGGYKIGPSSTTAALKGAVVYGSNSTFTDLKIDGSGVTYGCRNGSGATQTQFTRCQFRGGGLNSDATPLHFGSSSNSCSYITFTDCNVERSLTDETDYPYSGGGNCVNVDENVGSAGGAHMEYITFHGCHFGVDNGRRDIARYIGAPRMNVEMTHTGGTPVRHGYHNITFEDCIFEAANACTLDIAGGIYNSLHTDAYVTVEGCTFKGGGYKVPGSGDGWGYCITNEGNNHVSISDCDFYPSYGRVLTMLRFGGVMVDDWSVTGNRFHLDDDTYGCTRGNDPAIHLQGTGEFSGNELHNDSGSYYLLWVGDFYDSGTATSCAITGNTFHELRSTANTMVHVEDTSDCTITGNTFETAATSGPSAEYSGSNPGTTVISGVNNTLIHA